MSEQEKLENFFELDIKMKELLLKCTITDSDYDLESSMQYSKKLLDVLQIIKNSFIEITKYIGVPSPTVNKIMQSFDLYSDQIINSNYDYYKLKDIYDKYFCRMDENIIQEVNGELIGYNMFIKSNFYKILGKCTSINDYLHVFHSYVVNNDEIYSKIPLIETKINDAGYPINLRGDNNEVSKEIYDNIPDDLECANTDILAFKNKTLMMVRDKGHALTIEITEENNKMWVNYFIPKICNAQKVNKLPGVTKVKDDALRSDSTKGIFVLEKDEFITKFNEFLINVPTDSDMVFDHLSPRIA